MRLAELLGAGRKSRVAHQHALLDRRVPVVILGLDPGLGTTGWGAIRREGSRLTHIDNGEINTNADAPLGNRLRTLADALDAVMQEIKPDGIAVEEVFVNKNAQSTLKLAQARGVSLLSAARSGSPITEYAARLVKNRSSARARRIRIRCRRCCARCSPASSSPGRMRRTRWPWR